MHDNKSVKLSTQRRVAEVPRLKLGRKDRTPTGITSNRKIKMSHMISITFANDKLTKDTRRQTVHLVFSDEWFDLDFDEASSPVKSLFKDISKTLAAVGIRTVVGKKLTLSGIGYRVQFLPEKVDRSIETYGNDRDWRNQLIMAINPRLHRWGYELVSHTETERNGSASYIFKERTRSTR